MVAKGSRGTVSAKSRTDRSGTLATLLLEDPAVAQHAGLLPVGAGPRPVPEHIVHATAQPVEDGAGGVDRDRPVEVGERRVQSLQPYESEGPVGVGVGRVVASIMRLSF